MFPQSFYRYDVKAFEEGGETVVVLSELQQ